MALTLGSLEIDIDIDWRKASTSLKRVSKAVNTATKSIRRGMSSAMRGLTSVTLSVGKKMISIFQNAFNRIVRIIKNAMLISGLAISSFLIISTKMAIDVEEIESLFEKSFGNMADDVRKWSDEYSRSVNTNKFDSISFLSTIFNMTKGMKLTEEQALHTAKEVVTLGNDLKSAFNLKGDTAFEKIRSGLAGQSRPLQELGIFLSEENVKEFAQRTGIVGKSIKTLTTQQKALARIGKLREAMEDMGGVIGDMKDTLNSTQNRLRALSDGFREFSVNMGTAIKNSESFRKLLTLIEGLAVKVKIAIADNLNKSLAALDKHFGNRDNIEKWKKGLKFIADTAIKVKNAIALMIDKTIGWLSLADNQKKLLNIWEEIKDVSLLVVDGIKEIGLAIKAFALGTEEQLGDTGLTFLRLLDTIWAVGKITRIVGASFEFVNNILFEMGDTLGSAIGSFVRAAVVLGEFIIITQLLQGKLAFLKSIFSAIGATVLYFAEILGLASASAVSMGSAALGVLVTLSFATGWFFGKLLDWGGHFSDLLAFIIIQATRLINLIPGVNIGGIGTFGNDKSGDPNAEKSKEVDRKRALRNPQLASVKTINSTPVANPATVSKAFARGQITAGEKAILSQLETQTAAINRQPAEQSRKMRTDNGVGSRVTPTAVL